MPAKGKVTFRVVESTVGAKKTAGMVWFAYQGKRGKVDVIFAWSGRKAEVKVVGDGTFTRQAQAVEDLDRGNEYRMLFKEGGADAGEMLPPLADPDAPPEEPTADTPQKPPTAEGTGEQAPPGTAANPPATVTIVNESGVGLAYDSGKLEQNAAFNSPRRGFSTAGAPAASRCRAPRPTGRPRRARSPTPSPAKGPMIRTARAWPRR